MTSDPQPQSADAPKWFVALVGCALIGCCISIPFVTIFYMAKRDHEHRKPLVESLGEDLSAIHDIIPMLKQASDRHPLVVRSRALVLCDRYRGMSVPPTNPPATMWDPPVELDTFTFQLPEEQQATEADIRERRPITIFFVHQWSTPMGRYGRDGPVGWKTEQEVSVVTWPDLTPAHMERFVLLARASIQSEPLRGVDEIEAKEQHATDERGDARNWIRTRLDSAQATEVK